MKRLFNSRSRPLINFQILNHTDMNFISPAEFLKAVVSGEKILVLDVRDEDFIGGNIPNALNIPASEYDSTIVSDHIKDFSTVMVHCMYSQVRGPKIGRYIKRDYPEKDVFVLQGGFTGYLNEVLVKSTSQETDKVENLDMQYWRKVNGQYEYLM